MRLRVALISLALGTAGCESALDGPTTDHQGPYLPLAVGNSWTYRVTDPSGVLSLKFMTIVAEEPVGGTGPHANTMAFKFVSGDRVGDPEGSPSWRGVIGSRIVQYREVVVAPHTGTPLIERDWDPPRLRLDASADRIVAGATWREDDYTQRETRFMLDADGAVVPVAAGTTATNIQDIWFVASPSSRITVPAGTFDALLLRRVGEGGIRIKSYWFARGIGKVREVEEGTPKEELLSYHLVE